MGNKRKTHQECCDSVCLVCSRKKGNGILLTEELKDLFKQHLYPNYDSDAQYLPNSICPPCKTKLYSQGKPKEQKIKKLDWSAYANSVRQRGVRTRSSDKTSDDGTDQDCTCFICVVGHYSGKNQNVPPCPFQALDQDTLPGPGRPTKVSGKI